MPLPAGTRLGPYEIVSPIGAGGMGEVYRARDQRLNRIVAIKVLATRSGTSQIYVVSFPAIEPRRAISSPSAPTASASSFSCPRPMERRRRSR